MKTFTIFLCFFLWSCSTSSLVTKTRDFKNPPKGKSVLIPERFDSDKRYRIVLDQHEENISTTPNKASPASSVIFYIILGCTVGCCIIYTIPYFLKKIKKPDIV